MKDFLRVFFLALPLAAVPLFAIAAENDLPLESKEQIEPILPPEKEQGVVGKSAALDSLFEELGKDTKPSTASATARLIWREWSESGSASINLLMNWAGRAMGEKNFSRAEDMLDQVIVLAPEYAEGWNRRATLYFTMSDFSRSLSDIETTLALEPRHFGALSGLAVILQKFNRDEEALETWYRILELYPANKAAQNAVIQLEEKLAGRRT